MLSAQVIVLTGGNPKIGIPQRINTKLTTKISNEKVQLSDGSQHGPSQAAMTATFHLFLRFDSFPPLLAGFLF